jgi:tetratricopeptide (TPR) repeat protein
MEHWGEALLDYNRIIVLDDKNYQAYSRRALIHLQKKHFLEASADYAKLTELEPEKIDGKMGMALIEKRQQHWEQAESAYTDLVYRHRADAEIYVNRAECYINMKKLGRGLQDIEKALELGYSDPYIYMLRGQLRLRQFDKLSAKEDFEKAKSLGFDATVVDEYLKLINKK